MGCQKWWLANISAHKIYLINGFPSSDSPPTSETQWCSNSEVLTVCQAWIQRPTGMEFRPMMRKTPHEKVTGRECLLEGTCCRILGYQ